MKKYFTNSTFIIFVIIAIFYAIGNFIWWKINTPIIPHGISALHFLDIFCNGILFYNAPLITWIMKGIFFIFGKECFDLQIIIMNYMFFIVALYFIYKTGLELKNKETGNIAMVLFSLTPVVYELSRQYGHQEYHVMVAMIVNIYCLIKSKNLRDRKWSILYGLSVGFGLLIKDEFLAYFFMPWLYVVIRSLIGKADKNKIINILITVIIGSLIAGCHYFRLGIIGKILFEPIVEMSSIFSFESLRITTIGLSEYLLSPPIFILFIIGLIYFIYKYKSQNKWIILLWFIVPWTIITFMPHYKLVEYCLGFVPTMILFVAIYISNLKKILLKTIILFICIIICFLQFLDFSFDYNTKIFPDKITYRNMDISYYDRDYNNCFVVVRKYAIPFVKYYLNNFNRFNIKSCYFHNYFYEGYDISVYLNLMTKIRTYISINDIDTSEIIIFTQKYDLRKDDLLFETEKFCRYSHRWKYDEKELFKDCLAIKNNINNNYIELDDFYLDEDNKTPENHVYILGKKKLFEGKENIIKYPYKTQKTN